MNPNSIVDQITSATQKQNRWATGLGFPKQKVFSGAICRESWPNACPKPQLLGF